MNGAQSLLQTLVNGGVEVCFTNPGTSEMHFVAAVDKVVGMRTVLGLFEGVCTGAADGYARMAGKPAATLLHLGPGLGNGLANLHNARKGNSPIINIVGDHARRHLQYDAPLTADVRAFAKPVSDWIKAIATPEDVPQDTAEAILAALTPPGQISTLILPADCAWSESVSPLSMPAPPQRTAVASKTIDDMAQLLRKNESTIILLGGSTVMEEGLMLGSSLAKATGAKVIAEWNPARIQRGAGRAVMERVPYPVSQALKLLAGAKHVILVETKEPVAFFAYPNQPSLFLPDDCERHTLANIGQDGLQALSALAESLNIPRDPLAMYELDRPALPSGDISPEKVWTSVSAMMPEQAIVVDEAITSGREAPAWTAGAPPHDWLHITGGAIGIGIPLATGAGVACPDRQIISMQADGSAMYTLQALWTQAREELNIVTVLFSNRAYAILQGELKRVGAEPGPKALNMLDLGRPDLNWTQLAQGMGVPASRASTAEEFNQLFEMALGEKGPYLIEVMI